MKPSTKPFEREHQWARQTLPFLVNETLPEYEAQRLRSHLRLCADCRRELEQERALARRIAVDPVVEYTPQASLAQLTQRIDAAQERASGWRRWLRPRADGGRRSALVFVLAAQAAALAALALVLSWQSFRQEPAAYRTLASAPATPGAHLQVVFTDAVTAADMRAILARVRGRIVSGPSRAGVFLVAIEAPGADAGAELDAAARVLAGEPGVRYVAAQRASAPARGEPP